MYFLSSYEVLGTIPDARDTVVHKVRQKYLLSWN